MFASITTKRLDVPGHDGAWVEIRKLGWKKLREASEVASDTAYRAVKALGKEGFEAVREVTQEQIEAFKKDATQQLDATVLLRAAVVGWSFDRKVSPETLDDLEPAVADWLVREIVALSVPPKDEAAEKKS